MNIGRSMHGPGLLLALLLAWPPLAVAETLAYQVTYRGVFSAFQDVAIGDVQLEVDATGVSLDGQPIVRAWLSASSAAYPLVEEFYPYRYEFTSYHQPDAARSLAFERRKQTSKLRHDLLLLDWAGDEIRRFGISQTPDAASGEEPPPELFTALRRAGLPYHQAQFVPHPGSLATPPRDTLDRLALLQQVRDLDLVAGASRELTVTDGKEFIAYRATVAMRELVPTAAGPIPAWKVRIEGFETNDPEERPRHAPVYVWLDEGPRRLPLRFVSHHPAGKFTVDLQPQAAQTAAVAGRPDLPILY